LLQSKPASILTKARDGIVDWQNELNIRGLSPHTVDLYSRTVNKVLRQYPNPTSQEIRAYLAKRLKVASQTKVRNDQKALKSFFNFLEGQGLWLDNPVKNMKLIKVAKVIRQAISLTKLPFIIKRVLSISDTEKAIELGASAIIVSNQNYGFFDFGTPSVMALPEIVKVVDGRVTVLVDTEFRTGNDVFKGLALGTQAVGFAAPVLMASNAGGADYVEQFIGFIATELKRTMAICGCSDLSTIENSLLVTSPELTSWW